jgi:uncharacterized membrane protein
MLFNTKFITQAGIIASLYATLTIILAPISYGLIQVRFSEALTILPFITPTAIPGLFVGCLIANTVSFLGIVDVIGGSLCTLVAAFLTHILSRTKRPILAPLPPVVINAFGVSTYLHASVNVPYLLCVFYVGAGEIIACYLLGYPLLKFILGREKILRILKI